METTPQNRQYFEDVAEETLSKFEEVAKSARQAVQEASGMGAGALASINTLTSTAATNNLGQISREIRKSYDILSTEPAIARVVVVSEDDTRSTYYICRATPVTGVNSLASYRAPIGRLASMPVGEEFRLPNGNIVEILEKAILHPTLTDQVWDSRNTVLERDDFGHITIESFRSLIGKSYLPEQEEDILEQLLAEESEAANITNGLRRVVITKMGLRDQPVLDQYQDEIFRLPLDKQLLILGPPGTGKTTTLIRRLGQKLDLAFLDDEEQFIVDKLSKSGREEHTNSWLMFTPTDLLKHYLKESFAREGVPASDHRIKTWADFRWELARTTFGVLKTTSTAGLFVLKENIKSVTAEAIEKSIGWFSDFDEWQKNEFTEDLKTSALDLSKDIIPEVKAIGERLLSIVKRADDRSLFNLFPGLTLIDNDIRRFLDVKKEETDKRIKSSLNSQLKSNTNFIDELAAFIDELQVESDIDADEYDDQEGEEVLDNLPHTGRSAAIRAYLQVIRTQARAHIQKRNIGKNSRAGKIVAWLGPRKMDDAELAEIGASLLVQSNVRKFENPVKRYIDGIHRRYRTFRRLRQKEKRWYRADGIGSTDLHPLELDVILLTILRGANNLLSKKDIYRQIDLPIWSPLKMVADLYRNQILVDEVTDFSPVQIACMASLSHPQLRSFFACGDFNQRLTIWGSRSLEELKHMIPGIEVKEITVSYRQSRQLNELAHAIINAVGENDQEVILPKYVDNEGVSPVLLENAADKNAVTVWLANRIREIERFVGKLPSIAVFVKNDEEVKSLASTLGQELSENNARVVACQMGQTMGQDNDIRVFDVQYIKGLEFESVFFVGIDLLATQQPELFDKYLYVGTTRAATYLGITCEGALPSSLSTIRAQFVCDWSSI